MKENPATEYPNSINRIRLEFKALQKVHNRLLRVSVLIESDWNLKPYGYEKVSDEIGVLIESDWNLKHCQQSRILTSYRRINRIRLEFKVICKSNRTYW